MRVLKQKGFIILLLIIIFIESAFAQFKVISIMPEYQLPSTQPLQSPIQEQQPTLQQPSPQLTPTLIQLPTQPSYLEKPSEFEQYMSEKPIEITESQFEILKKFEGITFSYSAKNLSKDKTAIAVRVVKIPEGIERKKKEATIIDAGFIVGTPEAISNAFKILDIKVPFIISTDLKQFGYDFFNQPPSTFAPVDNVPVGPDYVIGPGDEIRINVWGMVELHLSVVVDRNGNITLPRIGTLGVAGLTFKELKELLYKEFSKYYTGFEMNVSMGSLRTIRVYVVGNANRPGAYTVSSLSTLVNALFEAGGPSKKGTMRDIQVKRNGKTLVHFDMYDLLLKGDKTKDIRLMPGDVIFIPPVGPLVGIAGMVKNPAIYELKGETRLLDLIEMAGGLTSMAFKGRVQVQRIENHQYITIFEGDLLDISKNNLILKDGDLVKIFPVVEEKNTIVITGAIANPGEYGITPGVTTVKDVISRAGGLLYYASNQAEVTRVKVTQEGPKTERFVIDLSKALKGDPQNNIPLEKNDYILVHTVPEWKLYRKVTIYGEVKFPGTYTIKKGEKLSSLIERAGGFTDKAYLKGAIFTRESVRELQQRHLNEMIERLERELLGWGTAEIGAALSPEEAKIKEYEIKQKREFIALLRNIKAKGRIVIKLDQPEVLKNTPYDIELEEGDSLFIPSNPQTIQVMGAVYNPNAFVYDKGKSWSKYIELAGGYTENADKKRVFILKVDGSAIRAHNKLWGISWSNDFRRWEFKGPELDPGDTIVVPEKLVKIPWMRHVKDLTQILYQIAVTAGVLIAVD